MIVIAASLGAVAAVIGAGLLVRRLPSPVGRVRPYIVGSRVLLALPPDRLRSTAAPWHLRSLPAAITALLYSPPDAALDRRLRHAGVMRTHSADERRIRYRARRLLETAAGGVLGIGMGALAGLPALGVLAAAAVGAAGALSYGRGRLTRVIEGRRDRMSIELYTVNQLLAMHVRTGASPIAAARDVTNRGRGEVIAELAGVLRLHRAGLPFAEALEDKAADVPEVHVARCFRMLASAHQQGGDVAAGLLALSEDIRDDRREALRRAATKARAMMLVPIVAFLAPVLLLFVAAPVPWIVFRGFGH